MLYQRQSFSCPAAPPHTTQEQWDRIFLTKDEYEEKYNVTDAEYDVIIGK